VADLKAAGALWIQFDEPTLVLDLEAPKLQAFTAAYSDLASALSGLNVLVETYFADIPAEAYKILTGLAGVTAFGFDLVRGAKTVDLIKGGFPSGKYLFAGVVDGRNIWANDLTSSLTTLNGLEAIVGKGISSKMHFMNILLEKTYKHLIKLFIHAVKILLLDIFILLKCMQINSLCQPLAHFSTLLLILLTRPSWIMRLNHG